MTDPLRIPVHWAFRSMSEHIAAGALSELPTEQLEELVAFLQEELSVRKKARSGK